jgi:hypothetical protein
MHVLMAINTASNLITKTTLAMIMFHLSLNGKMKQSSQVQSSSELVTELNLCPPIKLSSIPIRLYEKVLKISSEKKKKGNILKKKKKKNSNEKNVGKT